MTDFKLIEVLQASMMDCGPAIVTSFARGYGFTVDYHEIREYCETDADGSSYADLADVLCEKIGIPVEMSVVPREHLLSETSRYLPGITIALADGRTHVVLLGGVRGGRVTIMDPGPGIHKDRVQDLELYTAVETVDAQDWREHAESEEFLGPLTIRLGGLGLSRASVQELSDIARADESWRSFARLDASARFAQTMIERGALRATDASKVVESCFRQPSLEIPSQHWHVRQSEDDDAELDLFGVYVITLDRETATEAHLEEKRIESFERVTKGAGREAITHRPWKNMLSLVDVRDRWLLVLLSCVVGAVVFAEAVLFRGLLDEKFYERVSGFWIQATILVATFVVAAIVARWAADRIALQVGLRLGIRYRIRLRQAIQKCSPRFFESRIIADMAHRFHMLDVVGDLPHWLSQVMKYVASIAFAALAILLLSPLSALVLSVVVALISFQTWFFHAQIVAVENRLRSAEAGLANHFTNAVRARTPLKAHVAEVVVQVLQEFRLGYWRQASWVLLRSRGLVWSLNKLAAAGGFCAIAYLELRAVENPLAILVILYWYSIATSYAESASWVLSTWVPKLTILLIRLSEALASVKDPAEDVDYEAIFDALGWQPKKLPSIVKSADKAVSIEIKDVTVIAHSEVVLQDVALKISAGEHIAVVGRSGAGKSTIASLLMRHHTPSRGTVLIDGRVLDESHEQSLRDATIWVDPDVHLWNDSLLRNLFVGEARNDLHPDTLYDRLELSDIVARFERGGASPIGEEGKLLSGGEGQRVRLGRGLTVKSPRLVVMDEAFRGLDVARRRRLLRLVREEWRDATFVFVTHHIDDALSFDRVAVVEKGSIVEFDAPSNLMMADTHFKNLVTEHERLKRTWADQRLWRRVHVQSGLVKSGATVD